MTFLEKYEILKKSIPVPAFNNDQQSVDCEYSDNMEVSKHCYYSEGYKLEDCLYLTLCAFNKNVADCASVFESEKCYECVDCDKCHGCTYLMNCVGCTDCHFSALLNSCTDCFGCVGLSFKKYCIFNKQYSKEEYFKKLEELKKEKPEKLLERLLELKKQIPHPASQQSNNQNCPYGEYIYNSKNCYWCFNTLYNENCGYTFYSSTSKNCWDMYRAGGASGKDVGSTRCYEMSFSGANYECAFISYSYNCTNCYFNERLTNCSDCFGCVGLTNKKYCILNNQLTKEQYEKAVKDIKRELGWRV